MAITVPYTDTFIPCPRHLLALLQAMIIGATASAQGFTVFLEEVFIDEVHYNNSGTDANEAIEIAGPVGADLSGWSLVLYSGNSGAAYDTRNLSSIIPN
jgi:hypothetical protein